METSATLRFRRVTSADIWLLYAWRHEPQTNFWSLGGPPNTEEHQKWMSRAIANEDIYIAENVASGPVAVMEVRDTEISITVNPYVRGLGYGKQCIQFLKSHYPQLTATVIVGNTAGLKLFVSTGFDITDAQVVRHRPCVILQWDKEDA